jgi:hypothetical protein
MLKQDTGKDWVFQHDKNSPYFKFVLKKHDASKLAIESVDIDISDLDLRNPNHLLWYYKISDVKSVSGDSLTTDLLKVVSGTINDTGLRNLILEHGVGKAIEAGYKNIVLPWGVDHISDLLDRLKKQGYTVASQSSITHNPHCPQARVGSLEEAICIKLGITPLRNETVVPSKKQSDPGPGTDLGTETEKKQLMQCIWEAVAGRSVFLREIHNSVHRMYQRTKLCWLRHNLTC